MRTKLFLCLAAIFLTLSFSSEAHSWGAVHAGYTHVGPSGVYHYGHNAAVGPYGAYSGAHVSHYGGYGSAYHPVGTRTGNASAYGNAIYASRNPYAAGGFRTGGVYGSYGAGVYRRW